MHKNKTKYFPLVSVILNCHNGEKFLDKSVQSILKQTYKNWELIFIDNYSTDNTSSIINKIKDKRIKYFRTRKLYKLYKARNIAVSKAKGDLISFIDADDWWFKKKLEVQVKQFRLNKKTEVVYSNVYLYYQNKDRLKIYSQKELAEGKITQQLISDFKMPILSTMLKKKIFKKIKFFEKYEIIGDFDFLVRLSLMKNISAIQEPLAYYRIHSANLSLKKIYLNIKELENWLKKNNKKPKFKKFNFFNIQQLLQNLRIKNSLINGERILAFKQLFAKPFYTSRLKYLILFFMTKKYINKFLGN